MAMFAPDVTAVSLYHSRISGFDPSELTLVNSIIPTNKKAALNRLTSLLSSANEKKVPTHSAYMKLDHHVFSQSEKRSSSLSLVMGQWLDPVDHRGRGLRVAIVTVCRA